MRTQWLTTLMLSGFLVGCGNEAPPESAAPDVPEAAAADPEPEYTMEQVGRIGRDNDTDATEAPQDVSTDSPQPAVAPPPEAMDPEAQNSLEARDVES